VTVAGTGAGADREGERVRAAISEVLETGDNGRGESEGGDMGDINSPLPAD